MWRAFLVLISVVKVNIVSAVFQDIIQINISRKHEKLGVPQEVIDK